MFGTLLTSNVVLGATEELEQRAERISAIRATGVQVGDRAIEYMQMTDRPVSQEPQIRLAVTASVVQDKSPRCRDWLAPSRSQRSTDS